jgi:flagellar basal-body rod protein FlgF
LLREQAVDISAYVLLSHEQALRRQLDTVANNMANVGTIGFRREQPVFQEMLKRSDSTLTRDARQAHFVLDFGAVHDTTQGAFQATGNALDLAIQGPGYLAVALPDGGTAYTRAGNLKILEGGVIATANGIPVRGEGGQPITVPPEAMGRVSIAADGTVAGPEGPLGRIAVTVFEDEGRVDPRGDGLMEATNGRELAAAETKLRTGGLEGSNVQPIIETTHMIEIMRAYQTSQRMVDGISDMRKRAIERLGRAGN